MGDVYMLNFLYAANLMRFGFALVHGVVDIPLDRMPWGELSLFLECNPILALVAYASYSIKGLYRPE